MAYEHKCPNCGETEFDIEVTRTATVQFLRDGDHEVSDDASGDVEWSDGSHAQCTNCGHSGALGDMAKRRKKRGPALCVKVETNGQYAVTVEQHKSGHFRVSYGASIKDALNYSQAVQEFGSSVFHALACAGKLDNSKA